MKRSSMLWLAALALIAAAVSSARAGGTTAGGSVTVASTLDGKLVLPRRIRWLAFPKPAGGVVKQVDFLIDGKVRWVEHNAPYSFSDDGGYLVTSWLTPGSHRFTVRATTTSGRVGVDVVVARIAAAPDPPAALAGSWERTVAAPVPPDPAFPGDAVPAGKWTLEIDRRWVESRFPGTFNPATSPRTGAGNVLINDYTLRGRTLAFYGAVTTGLFNFHVATGGGWWCGPGGPKGTYSWSVSGDSLTLTPMPLDGCSQRGVVFAGTWERVK